MPRVTAWRSAARSWVGTESASRITEFRKADHQTEPREVWNDSLAGAEIFRPGASPATGEAITSFGNPDPGPVQLAFQEFALTRLSSVGGREHDFIGSRAQSAEAVQLGASRIGRLD